MPILDPEPLMDQAVRAARGRCVRELVGANPSFNNADYVFPTDNIVAELKELGERLSQRPYRPGENACSLQPLG